VQVGGDLIPLNFVHFHNLIDFPTVKISNGQVGIGVDEPGHYAAYFFQKQVVLGAEIEAGFIGEVLEFLLFFVIDEAAIQRYLVRFCSGEGKEVCPSESAGAGDGEQADCVENVLSIFVRKTYNDENGAVHAGVINEPDGFNNGLVGHVAIEDGVSDFLAAGFDAEFDNFAVGGRKVRCEFAVKKAEMCIDHKGQTARLFIESAKFLNVLFVKCEDVVVEEEGVYAPVIFEDKLYFVNYLFDSESADIVELPERTLEVAFVFGNHLVIKAVCAREGTAP